MPFATEKMCTSLVLWSTLNLVVFIQETAAPCYRLLILGEYVMQQIKDHTLTIAKALNTVGLINIQFAIKDDTVYIIEANPRASRTVPFICKAYGEPYVNYATKVMLRENKVKDFTFNPQLEGWAIKDSDILIQQISQCEQSVGT
jgi:carbamoyl-phosphate synthase large subunit